MYTGSPVAVADLVRRQLFGDCNAHPRQPLKSKQLQLNWLTAGWSGCFPSIRWNSKQICWKTKIKR